MANRATDTFNILEPQIQEIGEFYVVQEHCDMDFEALNFLKGLSGIGSARLPITIPSFQLTLPLIFLIASEELEHD